jgi:hypothetical protein
VEDEMMTTTMMMTRKTMIVDGATGGIQRKETTTKTIQGPMVHLNQRYPRAILLIAQVLGILVLVIVIVLVTIVIVADRETISDHCRIKGAHLATVVKIILIVMIATIVIRNFGERITLVTPTINIATVVIITGLISTIDSRIIPQHFQQWLA